MAKRRRRRQTNILAPRPELPSSVGSTVALSTEHTAPTPPAGSTIALSTDHKPDLPEERKRIEACGGVVTPAGPGGRPARVWADGRVGLAMSRSIGDFECKRCVALLRGRRARSPSPESSFSFSLASSSATHHSVPDSSFHCYLPEAGSFCTELDNYFLILCSKL